MSFKPDLSKLMQQAKEMQEKMQQAQDELAKLVVTGESGGGLVKVEMLGRHDVKAVSLDDSVIDLSEKEMLQDLIAAAVNDAVRKVEKETKSRMSSMAGELNLPQDLIGEE